MNKILNTLRYDASRPKYLAEALIAREMPKLTLVPCRTKYYHNRHRDPKYRKERARKVWSIDLPDFDKMRSDEKDITPDQIRSKLKEKGIAPPSPWNEREMYLPCTMSTIDPFDPPENGGKSSSLLNKALSGPKKLVSGWRQLNDIRNFEGDEFDPESFAKGSVDIYIKAHEALAKKDDQGIFDYVTEHCFPVMTAGLNRHTIVWKYLGDIEPPKLAQVRCGDQLSKGNKYGQITVRLHTKQILAVYDRHGRLVHGSPTEVKEVLEYIVFEKYLANEYGLWRIHDRIRPKDPSQTLASRQIAKTYVLSNKC